MAVSINPILLAIANGGGSGGGGGTYGFNRSLRLRSSASAYMRASSTLNSASSKKFSISFWYRNTHGATGTVYVMGKRLSGEGEFSVSIGAGKLNWRELNTTLATTTYAKSCSVSRWPTAETYHHVFLRYDSTAATASDRAQVWIDGTRETSFSSSIDPTLNLVTCLATMSSVQVSGYNNAGTATGFANGNIAGLHILDGIAAAASDFGVISGSTWVPKPYTGSYGTCGSQLLFGDASSTTTLVADTSGNARAWTGTNLSVTSGVTFDQMYDVPYDENATISTYAVLDPDTNTGPDPIWGGLRATFNASSGYANSTIGMTTGKWYAEVTVNTGSFYYVGVANAAPGSTYVGGDANSWAYSYDGKKQTNGGAGAAGVAYGASTTSGDVIGILFDRTAGTLTFYKNNVSQGVAYTGLTSGTYYFAIGAGGSSGILDVNFGQRAFAYSMPSGALALNSFNA